MSIVSIVSICVYMCLLYIYNVVFRPPVTATSVPACGTMLEWSPKTPLGVLTPATWGHGTFFVMTVVMVPRMVYPLGMSK